MVVPLFWCQPQAVHSLILSGQPKCGEAWVHMQACAQSAWQCFYRPHIFSAALSAEGGVFVLVSVPISCQLRPCQGSNWRLKELADATDSGLR